MQEDFKVETTHAKIKGVDYNSSKDIEEVIFKEKLKKVLKDPSLCKD